MVSQSLNPASLPARPGIQGIEARLQSMEEALPTLPSLMAEAQSLLGEDAGAHLVEVERLLAQSPSLTARVLRLANSVLYGAHGTVTTPSQAVARLGLRNVRAAILAEGMQSLGSRKSAPHPLFSADALWEHSIAVMCAARRLSQLGITPGIGEEELGTAGLLHDLGRMSLLRLAPAECAKIGQLLTQVKGLLPFDAERAVLGCTHEDIGALLARHWKLPPLLVATTGGHGYKSFEKSGDEGAEPDPFLRHRAVIHVADGLANQMGLGHRWGAHQPLSPVALTCLGLPCPSEEEAQKLRSEPTKNGAEDILTKARSGLHRDVAQARQNLGG